MEQLALWSARFWYAGSAAAAAAGAACCGSRSGRRSRRPVGNKRTHNLTRGRNTAARRAAASSRPTEKMDNRIRHNPRPNGGRSWRATARKTTQTVLIGGKQTGRFGADGCSDQNASAARVHDAGRGMRRPRRLITAGRRCAHASRAGLGNLRRVRPEWKNPAAASSVGWRRRIRPASWFAVAPNSGRQQANWLAFDGPRAYFRVVFFVGLGRNETRRAPTILGRRSIGESPNG